MPGEDYISKRLSIARRGLNFELEPTLMKGDFTPYMKNMMLDKGGLRKFPGYALIANNPNFRSIGGSEVGCALHQFTDGDGKNHVLAFTDDTAFDLDLQTSVKIRWRNINPGITLDRFNVNWADAHANITIAIEASAGIKDSALKIAGDSSFSDALIVGYRNFESTILTGYTHVCGWVKTTVATGESLKLVISESANAAKSGDYVTIQIRTDDIVADEWRFFCEEVDLSSMNAAVSIGIWNDAGIAWTTGTVIRVDEIRAITLLHHVAVSSTYRYRYDFAIATDVNEFTEKQGRALIVTSYDDEDDLMYYEGSRTGADLDPLTTLVHGISDFKIARCIIEFWNHFFIGCYTIDTTKSLMALGHAAIGDIDDWSSAGSGFYNLTDTRGEILRLTKTDYMMNIYSEFSISRGIWYGTYILFTFPCIMPNLGLFTESALVQAFNGDYFIGSDQNIYFMPIGQKPLGVGAAITPTLFDLIFVGSWKVHIASGLFGEMNRILFAIPTVKNQYPTDIYVLDTRTKGWEYYVFEHKIRDFEFVYTSEDAPYINLGIATYFITDTCRVYKIAGSDVDLLESSMYPVLRSTSSQDDLGLTKTTAITNLTELQAMTATGNYYLANDIDASASTELNGGAGFVPIGISNPKFTGTFDGCGYTISDLYIDRNSNAQALFGYVGPGARIANVTLSNVDITGGGYYCGALAGYVQSSDEDDIIIQNCHASGTITSTGVMGYYGGLIGQTSIIGGNTTGRTHIYDSSSSCNIDQVNATTYDYRGGFIGLCSNAVVKNCFATGSLINPKAGDTGTQIGGFAGLMGGAVDCSYCYATGDVDGNDSGRLYGGFVGKVTQPVTIYQCYVTGDVSGKQEVGGFAGYIETTSGAVSITDCYARGDATTTGAGLVGGFIGVSDDPNAIIINVYSTGEVTGDANDGGLIGDAHESMTVTDCYWDTDTSEQSTTDEDLGTGKTTSWLKTKLNYPDPWDFDSIWIMPYAEFRMDDENFPCEYQTEDVTIDEEHSNARWKWFTFTGRSFEAESTVTIEYSTNNGETWTEFADSPIALESSWATHRIPLDILSRVIRFRFTQTAGDLQIKANMFYGYSQDTEE